MKKGIILFICTSIICLPVIFAGCNDESGKTSSPGTTETTGITSTPTTTPTATPAAEPEEVTIEDITFSKFDQTAVWDEETAVKISLNGTGADIQGTGASVDGKKIKISYEGSYIISGTLDDGQILVDVAKTEKVHLILNGVTVTCSDSAPIYISSADKVSITLVDGTTNTFTDANEYKYEIEGETKPNACIYSKDDLTFNGNGTLIVNGNYNNGIGSKNDLKIISGNITVNAVKNALKGNDSVVIKDGKLMLKSDNDGIKSDNEVDETEGVIYIFGGTINIDAGDDGIQAYTKVRITGAKVSVKYMGKDVNCSGNLNVDENCIVNE